VIRSLTDETYFYVCFEDYKHCLTDVGDVVLERFLCSVVHC